MPTQLGKVLIYTLVPVVAGGLGGIVAAFWPPTPPVRSAVQHFAAGVVLAAAALELLPQVRHQSPWIAVIGFYHWHWRDARIAGAHHPLENVA